jgi:hypothetical protein
MKLPGSEWTFGTRLHSPIIILSKSINSSCFEAIGAFLLLLLLSLLISFFARLKFKDSEYRVAANPSQTTVSLIKGMTNNFHYHFKAALVICVVFSEQSVFDNLDEETVEALADPFFPPFSTIRSIRQKGNVSKLSFKLSS